MNDPVRCGNTFASLITIDANHLIKVNAFLVWTDRLTFASEPFYQLSRPWVRKLTPALYEVIVSTYMLALFSSMNT
jgi:hypothetical protein